MTNCLFEQELCPLVSWMPVLTVIFRATAKFSHITSSLGAPLHETKQVPPGYMRKMLQKCSESRRGTRTCIDGRRNS